MWLGLRWSSAAVAATAMLGAWFLQGSPEGGGSSLVRTASASPNEHRAAHGKDGLELWSRDDKLAAKLASRLDALKGDGSDRAMHQRFSELMETARSDEVCVDLLYQMLPQRPRKAGLIAALSELGASATPGAERMLGHADADVRWAATRILSRTAVDGAANVDALAGALVDADWTVRRGAADALACLGPKAAPAAPELGRALNDQDAEVRWRAAYALSRIGRFAASQRRPLELARRDADEGVRRMADFAASAVDAASSPSAEPSPR